MTLSRASRGQELGQAKSRGWSVRDSGGGGGRPCQKGAWGFQKISHPARVYYNVTLTPSL